MRYRPFAAFAAASLFCLPVAPAQPTDYLATEPVDGATYGVGFDLRNRQVYNAHGGCVVVDENAVYESAGGEHESHVFISATNSTVLDKTKTDAGASLKAFNATVTGKLSMLDENASSAYRVTLYAYNRHWQPATFLHADKIRLTDEAREMLIAKDTHEFETRCGQGFVIGIRKGREFVGRAIANTSSIEAWSKWNADVEIEGNIEGVEFDGAGSVVEDMKAAFGSERLAIETWSTNPPEVNPTTIDEVMAAHRSFNEASDPSVMVKMFVAPYSVATNYPSGIESSLTPPSVQEEMIDALWDYSSLIADADFIIDNHEQFAMGLSSSVRDKTLQAVRTQRSAWEATKTELIKRAEDCFDSAETCSPGDIAITDVLSQRDRLPRRYMSRCAGHQIAADVLDADLGTFDLGRSVRDDEEMDGGPVRFHVKMCTRERNDALHVWWQVKAREWKTRQVDGQPVRDLRPPRKTEFVFERESLAVDVVGQGQNGLVELGDTDVSECRFHMKPTRQRLEGKACEGRIEHTTHDSPEGTQRLTADEGSLRSLMCQADKPGPDNGLTCDSPRHDRLDLRMFNVEDLRYEDNPRLPILAEQRAAIKETLRNLTAAYASNPNAPVAPSLKSQIESFEHTLRNIESAIADARADQQAVRGQAEDAAGLAPSSRRLGHRTEKKRRSKRRGRPLVGG